jgi:hypothetical protein
VRSQASRRQKRKTPTKASTQIPIRIFADCKEPAPGFLEIDFVAHGGSSMQGTFLWSLAATDVCSGWTELVPLAAREQSLVVEGLEVIRRQLPVPVLGIDPGPAGRAAAPARDCPVDRAASSATMGGEVCPVPGAPTGDPEMPPRFVTVAIVVFWLATLGWFFQHDLWPRLRPGERPPYNLDLANEVTGRTMPHHWQVFRNGITIGDARTWVLHNEDDTYNLVSKFHFHHFTFGPVHVLEMDSTYRVTRDGQLRELDAEVDGALAAPLIDKDAATGKVHVHGIVADGLFTPQWHVKSPLGEQDLKSQPVAVASNHSVLNPMQPWNRLLDLQENRTWRIELFDPLMGSLSNLLPGVGQDGHDRTLEAGVMQGTQNLGWDNKDVPCLVIEYRGEGITGRTFIRQSDGLVLRQEAVRGEDRLALERIPR